MSVQIVAFQGSGESWRLWAALAFAILFLWSCDRMVLYGLLLRLESEQAAKEGQAANSGVAAT